jgi:hypothetical protein
LFSKKKSATFEEEEELSNNPAESSIESGRAHDDAESDDDNDDEVGEYYKGTSTGTSLGKRMRGSSNFVFISSVTLNRFNSTIS